MFYRDKNIKFQSQIDIIREGSRGYPIQNFPFIDLHSPCSSPFPIPNPPQIHPINFNMVFLSDPHNCTNAYVNGESPVKVNCSIIVMFLYI